MIVTDLSLPGLKLIEPRLFEDARGYFFESYQAARYLREAGIDCPFMQDNHSVSNAGVIRGLHYQASPGQAKLVRCSRGRIFDVAVDLRHGSPTFGKWISVELDDETHRQHFIPVGFAHGFQALTERAEVSYKCSSLYDASAEFSISWSDPHLAIAWPLPGEALLSDRDAKAPSFRWYRSMPPIFHFSSEATTSASSSRV